MNSTLCLVRQDPARGGLLRAVASCLAAGLLLRMVPDLGKAIAELSVENLPVGFAPIYLLLTALTATFLLGANAWTRSSRLAPAFLLRRRRPLSTRWGAWSCKTLRKGRRGSGSLNFQISIRTA